MISLMMTRKSIAVATVCLVLSFLSGGEVTSLRPRAATISVR